MLFNRTEMERINRKIEDGAKTTMKDTETLKKDVDDWLKDKDRELMITGEQYYLNHSDIQEKERTLADGRKLNHRANNKLEHGFIRKLVDQKTGYLLSKLPSIEVENKQYEKLLKQVFNRTFWRLLKTIGRESINKGISWLQIYFDRYGMISFKLMPSEQIIPVWVDNTHTEIREIIRVYDIEVYEGKEKKRKTKVERWTADGVFYYVVDGDELIDDVEIADENGGAINYHAKVNNEPFNWGKVPFIPFRANDLEQPFIDILKSLIDNYNLQASVNADLLADIPKAVYKLINYGGENLDDFINDLQEYLAIKLENGGNVELLQAQPNTVAIEAELNRMRKEIYSYGRGIDTQSEDMGVASGVALKFRYSDLDNESSIIETEFQYSMEQLIWFINQYLLITGQGDFTNEHVNIIFNRDQITNEAEIIQMCKDSVGLMPDIQIRSQHPWSNENTEKLWEEQEAKKQEELDQYNDTFKPNVEEGAINATIQTKQ